MMTMKKMFRVLVLFLCLFVCSSVAQNTTTCPAYTFTNNNQYTACNALPALNSFLHWNYFQLNNTIDIAYRHTGITPSNWVAWSLNPTGNRMVGSQCLVALLNSTTNAPRVYTSPIASYAPQMQEAPLSFSVPSMRAEFSNGQMIIYATIVLPAGRTSFQQVWQHGDVSASGALQPHRMTQDHLSSFSTIDFATGTTINTGAGSGGSRQTFRKYHGIMNVVSWGIMMPIGVMAARYVKAFDLPNSALWFHMHVSCQASGYVVGVVGGATGMVLGRDSPGVQHTTHRNLGIAIFVLGTLQALAIRLRPNPDHKYRRYWNYYHHYMGYTVVGLSITNVVKGFDILDPEKKWKRAYIGTMLGLGSVALCLEAIIWFLFYKRKREISEQQNGA